MGISLGHSNARGLPALAILVVATWLGSCSDSGNLTRAPDAVETLFLAQNVVPNATMEALFQGRIIRDRAGCLRLQAPDDATVVWPKGFTLRNRSGELAVLDSKGRKVGRIGGAFRLGGGEVPLLHDGIGLSSAARRQAEARCPGRYWIVGTIPLS